MSQIPVTDTLSIDSGELRFEFIRASGPGGQHVNKTSTAVQLRFDVAASPSLTEAVRQRLIRLAGNRLTVDGILVIEARQFRSQERNREDAVERLLALIRMAIKVPKRRRPTKPTLAAKRRRLTGKRKRSEVKRTRRSVGGGD